MKARDVIDRLFGSVKGITPARIEKAKKLTQRCGLEWADVLAAMDTYERAAVEHPR